MRDMMTIPEAAEYLNVSTKFVFGLMFFGAIGFECRVDAEVTAPTADVVRWKREYDARRDAALDELGAMVREDGDA